jgi:hypothetical protein
MRGNYRILLATVMTTAFAAVCVAGVADAAVGSAISASKEKQAALNGTSEWSSVYAISGTFDGKLGHGTYSGTLVPGSTTFATDTCGPVCADVAGTITFTTNRGSFTAEVQPGGLVQLDDIASHSTRAFSLDLEIVDGTRRYSRADGALRLSYTSVWTHTTVNGVFVDEIEDTGTLVGKLH